MCCLSVYGTDGQHISNLDRKSTRLNSSHSQISYAVFCLKKNHTQNPYSTTVLFKGGGHELCTPLVHFLIAGVDILFDKLLESPVIHHLLPALPTSDLLR